MTAHTRWTNLGVAYLALVAAFIPYVGWSPALSTITEDLGLTYSQAGALSSATGLVAGLALLTGGILSRKWGSKTIVMAGLTAGLMGQLIFAAAESYPTVMAGRLVSGLAVGFLFVGTFTLAVEWFHEGRQAGRALGIMMTGDGVGSLVILSGLALLLTAFGWRTGLAIQGGVLMAVLVVTALVAKDVPTAPAEHPTRQPAAADSGIGSAFRLIRERNVALAIAYWVGGVGLFALISSWMPTVLAEEAGWSTSSAGFATSLFAVVGMVAALSSPYIARRVGGKKRLILMAGTLAAVAVGTLTLGLATDNYLLSAICIPIAGLGIYAGEPIALAEAVESGSPSDAGVINGLVIGVPWIVSGFAYPYVMGAVKDASGSFTGGFWVLTVATVVCCVISPMFIREPQPESADAETSEVLA